MLDINVGEVRAAVEGREPTLAERRQTVRDLARATTPISTAMSISRSRPWVPRFSRASRPSIAQSRQ